MLFYVFILFFTLLGKSCSFRPKEDDNHCPGEEEVKSWYFNGTACNSFVFTGCIDGVKTQNPAFISDKECRFICKQETSDETEIKKDPEKEGICQEKVVKENSINAINSNKAIVLTNLYY